jgi:hypothetical protein
VAAIELGELLTAVQHAYDSFTAATRHAAASSRVIDGSAAYGRLLEQLKTELSMERPYVDEVLVIPPALTIPLLAKHQVRD